MPSIKIIYFIKFWKDLTIVIYRLRGNEMDRMCKHLAEATNIDISDERRLF
jgi:hypothetical protein